MNIYKLPSRDLIFKDAKVAQSLADQIFGLLRSSNPRCLVFFTRFGIHTFGLKTAIDVMILDSNYKVAAIKSNLPPNSCFFWNPKYFIVIEMPNNLVDKKNIKTGDLIILKRKN